MNVDRITALAKDYQSEIEQTEERRKVWEDTVKKTLFETLTTIIDSTDLDWWIDKNEYEVNLQSLFLTFRDKASGIKKVTSEASKAFVEKAAYLGYHQMCDGKIAITVNYPYVEEKQTQKKSDVIEYIEPSSLNSDKIVHHVETFLKKIISFKQSEDQSMGF